MDETAKHRILIIDDNRSIHEDFRKILSEKTGGAGAYGDLRADLFGESEENNDFNAFEIDSAFQGRDGVEMAKQALDSGRPYCVAFIDVRMPPGWDGVETTARLWDICPDLQVVICTAYSDYSWDEVAAKFGQNDGLLILKKPFDTIEVLQLAQTLSRKWALTRQARLRVADLDAMVNERTEELRASNEKLTLEIAERSKTEKALRTAQEELRQSQKLEAIGQLAGGVAHDFNNLLAVIRGNADLARMQIQVLPRELNECLNEIGAASDRAANLTRQLLAFSRKQMMQPQPVDLDKVIMNLSKMLKRIIGEHIDLRCIYAPALPRVQADVGMIEQVLINLVVNARDAMQNGGKLLITTEQLSFHEGTDALHPEARPGDFVCVTVKDTGTGICEEDLPRIFNPFFTTKEIGKGTGLGLSTVYGIVKQHQGWVEVSSQVGAGSSFRIYFPGLKSTPAVSDESTPAAAVEPPPVGKEIILLVEDDEAVRSITRLFLERHGYRVLEASSGPEALKIWESVADKVDLLLTDVIMPGGVTGRDLAEGLLEKKSSLKIVLQSGYGGDVLSGSTDFLQRTNSYFLQKPCPPREMLRAVRRCLDGLPAKGL
ncbi:MAG TPA: response regulator [Verrucomicrobiae bacterium]|jgi:signal transduction histidine kinase|nr:response regulator [Verrucomicrobiae bacterium]